jgi:hypothetical protein
MRELFQTTPQQIEISNVPPGYPVFQKVKLQSNSSEWSLFEALINARRRSPAYQGAIQDFQTDCHSRVNN